MLLYEFLICYACYVYRPSNFIRFCVLLLFSEHRPYLVHASKRNFLHSHVYSVIGPNVLHFPALSQLGSKHSSSRAASLIGTDFLADAVYIAAPSVNLRSR